MAQEALPDRLEMPLWRSENRAREGPRARCSLVTSESTSAIPDAGPASRSHREPLEASRVVSPGPLSASAEQLRAEPRGPYAARRPHESIVASDRRSVPPIES